jgi:hypothetical protein
MCERYAGAGIGDGGALSEQPYSFASVDRRQQLRKRRTGVCLELDY